MKEINFSKYQGFFMSLSFCAIVGMLAVTYLHYGGFAASLSFDGGIRFSLQLPEHMGKKELEDALKKSDLGEDYIIRQTSLVENHWDLEFGPELRDKLAAIVAAKEAERQARRAELRKQGMLDTAAQESASITGEIEAKLLPLLNIAPEAVLSSETIAASYGANLTQTALRILIYTIIAIGLYLSFRFDLPFAIGSSCALIHDLLFTLGLVGVMRIEPSIPVLAAVLTTLGYSINDTIVIFDRIRENSQEGAQATSKAIVNISLTQTLSRTMITSLLTLLAVAAILLGGERSLRDFAVVILFGVLIGTYSSLFIAAPCVHYYGVLRKKLKRL